MALDIQTIAMTGSYLPYERPPQPYTLWSAIPRGLQSFIVGTEQLDAKALNDDALLQLQATLPPNFGYVLQDVNATISQNVAFNWSAVFNLNLQNFYRAPEDTSLALAGNWKQDFIASEPFAVTQKSMVVINPWPSYPMIGTPGTTGIQVNMTMGNGEDAAGTVGTVNAYISFWVFDLEQVRKYPINSPQPVHSR